MAWQVALGTAAGTTLLLNTLLVSTPLSPSFWRGSDRGGLASWAYGRTSRDALKDRWLARRVPDEAPLLSSPMLAPHLAHRRELHIAVPTDGTEPPPLGNLLDQVDYVALDGLFEPAPIPGGGFVGYDWPTLVATLVRPEFGLVSSQDGLLLLQRRPDGIADDDWLRMTLALSLDVRWPDEPPVLVAEFGEAIGLVEATVTPISPRRCRLRYAWLALSDPVGADPWLAVTELDGVADARILHVPTIALYSTTEWRQGEVIVEEFEVDLPDHVAPGEHTLRVGWYDSRQLYAYATDERSRIRQPIEAGILTVR